jgi:hypothetical protein
MITLLPFAYIAITFSEMIEQPRHLLLLFGVLFVVVLVVLAAS